MKLSKAIIQELERILKTNPNVVGYSSTTKRRLGRGGRTENVIRIYVEKDLRGGTRLPRAIRGVRVDVMVLGRISTADTPEAPQLIRSGTFPWNQKARPLQGGVTAINAIGKLGTLGYFLRDDTKPAPPQKPQWYILSNAHVLDVAGSRDEVLQPSPLDKGRSPGDVVGSVTKSVLNDRVDAAIAKIDVGAIAQVMYLITPTAAKVVTEKMVSVADTGFWSSPRTGTLVEKRGRSTGLTIGRIIDGNLRLDDLAYPSGRQSFRDCLLVESDIDYEDFQLPGDSGSLLIDSHDQAALGLMFAYRNLPGKAAMGIACRMEHVLAAFSGKIMVKPGESWP